MIREDISMFVDGAPADESKIATAILTVEDYVVFKDDAGKLFFLADASDSYETGLVAMKTALTPIAAADVAVKEKILAAVTKEGA